MSNQISNDLLRIPSINGSPINEYRIHGGQIEFRALDARGSPFLHNRGSWRALSAADVQWHFALKTEVARWLMHRIGADE